MSNQKEFKTLLSSLSSCIKTALPLSKLRFLLSIEFFSYLIEKSRDVFWIRTVDYKTQVYVSPAYEVIWGRTCASLYEHPEEWINFIFPEDFNPLEMRLEKRNEKVESDDYYYESYRIVRPDGEIRWIEDHAFPIHDEEGLCVGFSGIARDVTQDKEREQLILQAKLSSEAALKARDIAEAENRKKSKILKNILESLKKKRYYLAGKNYKTYLTCREAQCLLCLARGNSAKQIGKILKISNRTVECHLNNIKRKLNCRKHNELIHQAIESSFLEGIKPIL